MIRRAGVVAVAAVVAVAPALWAQSMDESVQQAMSDYSAWMDALDEFTKGIEFDESDLNTMIELYPEMDSLELMADDDDDVDPESFNREMQEVLADPEYRGWATRNGLDPENWLRTVSRITSVYLVVSADKNRPLAEQQRQKHAAMVEEQCRQVDPELCRSLREGLAASDAINQAIAEAHNTLRPPTAQERALMEEHYGDLEALMMADDESDMEDESWGEYDDSSDDGE